MQEHRAARTKRHGAKAPLGVVRGKEGKLLLITMTNRDSMAASFVVQRDEMQASGRVAKVVNSIVAKRDGVFKRQGDLVQATTQETRARQMKLEMSKMRS